MNSPEQIVNVRYMVDDVQAAIDFYTSHLGFTLRSSAAPAFADATRGNLRLLLAGEKQILVVDQPGTWSSCWNPRPVPRLARDPAGLVHQGGESVW